MSIYLFIYLFLLAALQTLIRRSVMSSRKCRAWKGDPNAQEGKSIAASSHHLLRQDKKKKKEVKD